MIACLDVVLPSFSLPIDFSRNAPRSVIIPFVVLAALSVNPSARPNCSYHCATVKPDLLIASKTFCAVQPPAATSPEVIICLLSTSALAASNLS